MNDYEYEIRRLYLLSGRTVDSRNEEAIELMAQEVIKAGIDLDTLQEAGRQLIKANIKRFGIGDILELCGQYKPVKKIVYPPQQFNEDGEIEYHCNFCRDVGYLRATEPILQWGKITSVERSVACCCRLGKQIAEVYGSRYYHWDGVSETIETDEGREMVVAMQ
jgi:hypothetical protein